MGIQAYLDILVFQVSAAILDLAVIQALVAIRVQADTAAGQVFLVGQDILDILE